MKTSYHFFHFEGYKKYFNYSSIANHPELEEIERRIRIINFFDKYGDQATKEAFCVCRSTVYNWKAVLKKEGGRLTSLAPKSRSPRRRPKRQTNPLIIDFIKSYRTTHPGVGKEAIKPQLDKYCKDKNIQTISESTIGRIIYDLKQRGLVVEYNSQYCLNGRTGTLYRKPFKRKKKKLRRKGYQPEAGGDLFQMDSIAIFHGGIKRYLVTAVDVKTEFGFAYCYSSLSSLSAKDFLIKLKRVAPFKVKRIQTDNGKEFEKLFRQYIEKSDIVHFHNYPKHPQSNCYVERFNRTVKEQFVRWNIDLIHDVEKFNRALMNYLLWYNTEKPHRSLNKEPPLKYYVDNFLSTEKSNMSWTPTCPVW